MRRLFVSFDLPAPLQKAIAVVRHRIDPALPARMLSWVEPSTLHVTLRFLGNVDATAIPQLQVQLRAGLAGCRPIPVRCHGLGWLPGLRRPRVLYARVSAEPGMLEDLHRRVREATVGVGVAEVDRPSSPMPRWRGFGRPTAVRPSIGPAGSNPFTTSSLARGRWSAAI